MKAVFSKSASIIPTAALAFGISHNANALEIGCYSNKQAIVTDMVNEDLVPITKFRVNTATKDDKRPKYDNEEIVLMNPRTKQGNLVSKTPDEQYCVYSKLSNITIFNTHLAEPPLTSYTSEARSPKANSEGGAKGPAGINRHIHGLALSEKQMPMIKADEDFPALGISSGVFYIVANPRTESGTVLRANKEGIIQPQYTRLIPPGNQTGKEYGVRFTDMVSPQSVPVAAQQLPTKSP